MSIAVPPLVSHVIAMAIRPDELNDLEFKELPGAARRILEVVAHSPTGLEWGYRVSGLPTQLALADRRARSSMTTAPSLTDAPRVVGLRSVGGARDEACRTSHRCGPDARRGRVGARRSRCDERDRTRAAAGTGTVQLPPEILVDRHLVPAERLLAAGDPADALDEMNEILGLQAEHDLLLQDDFAFQYAQVAYAARRTQTALELLDSAAVRLEREAAERRRAEAARRRAARWPLGPRAPRLRDVPEMVVLAGERCGVRRLAEPDGRHYPGGTAVGARVARFPTAGRLPRLTVRPASASRAASTVRVRSSTPKTSFKPLPEPRGRHDD